MVLRGSLVVTGRHYAGKTMYGLRHVLWYAGKGSAKLANLKAPVQGIFALRDSWITKDLVQSFENQMKELKKPISISWLMPIMPLRIPVTQSMMKPQR